MEILNKLSIVIPAYNVSSVIDETLKSLKTQVFTTITSIEVIIVNDGSKDDSLITSKKALDASGFEGRIIDHGANKGISAACNSGIKAANGEFVSVMQADIIFEETNALQKMVTSIESGVVGTYPYVLHPRAIWNTYPFWQKALFDRLVETKSEARFAKLGIARKETFKEVGYYPEEISSGEDRDMFEKMMKLGKVSITDTNVIHIHSRETNFSIMRLLDKEAQEAEGAGALIKKYGIKKSDLGSLILILARPIMALSVFIPLSWPFLLLFIYLYTKNLYKYYLRDKDILKLPFVTIARIWIYSFYLAKGFKTGKAVSNHFKW